MGEGAKRRRGLTVEAAMNASIVQKGQTGLHRHVSCAASANPIL